jgi:hypothetical protein
LEAALNEERTIRLKVNKLLIYFNENVCMLEEIWPMAHSRKGSRVIMMNMSCGLAVLIYEEGKSSIRWGVGRDSSKRFANGRKATNPES